jgi:pyruvate carboxylase subunit B
MFPDLGREYLEQRASGTLVPEPLEPADSNTNGGKKAATEFNVSMHGETYHVKITGKGYTTHDKRPYYISIDGVPEEVLLEPLEEISLGEGEEGQRRSAALSGSGRPRATEPGHVTTSMPGNIVDVLVNVGDEVKAGDPVLITEAMKMETEVQAPVSGVVTEIHVKKGESVTPDETLIEIE